MLKFDIFFKIIASFCSLEGRFDSNIKLENSKLENELSSDKANCQFQCFISFSLDAQLICAFVFCRCKDATQCLLGIALISLFFYINIYLSTASPSSYRAKFVLDLFEIPKGKFYHDEAHVSKIIQYNYSYLV